MRTENLDPKWREMGDEERAIYYSPSSALHGPVDPYIRAYVDDSKAAYKSCPDVITRAYGAAASNSYDFVAPKSVAPVPCHVFIHGGYWQQLSKRESFFPAKDSLGAGMAFAAVDYTLAPHATLDDIVNECGSAIARIKLDAEDLNIDPERIIVSGSSAGAHLAAMSCLKLPIDLRPKGLVLLSGVYELEPLIGTYINDAVGMDTECARRNSPMFGDLRNFPQTLIAWGEHETDEFKRQSSKFAALLKASACNVESFEVAGRNHFDIVADLANKTVLGRKLRRLSTGRK